MKRKTLKPAYTQIWFVIDGSPRRWRCEHQAGWFRIHEQRDRQTELTCAAGKRHRIASGFYLQKPVDVDAPVEPEPPPYTLRGLQLRLFAPIPQRGTFDWSFLANGRKYEDAWREPPKPTTAPVKPEESAVVLLFRIGTTTVRHRQAKS